MRIMLMVGFAALAGISGAAAQTAMDGYGDSGAMPSIILPDQLTNPITGDFNARKDFDPGDDAEVNTYPSEGEAWVQPYSVEGEETLEPETN